MSFLMRALNSVLRLLYFWKTVEVMRAIPYRLFGVLVLVPVLTLEDEFHVLDVALATCPRQSSPTQNNYKRLRYEDGENFETLFVKRLVEVLSYQTL